MKSSLTENLFQPAMDGGLGCQRFTANELLSLARVLFSWDQWSKWVVHALQRWGRKMFIWAFGYPAIYSYRLKRNSEYPSSSNALGPVPLWPLVGSALFRLPTV